MLGNHQTRLDRIALTLLEARLMVSQQPVELLAKLAGGPHHLRSSVRKVFANGFLQGVEALHQLGSEFATDLALLGLRLAEAPLE